MSELFEVPFAVLTIGSELLDGRTLERNVNYLGGELHALGARLAYGLQCGDSTADIHHSLRFLIDSGAQCIIISGGLGPTVDDMTRQAVASFAAVSLERDPIIVEKLKSWFAARGRDFAESNALQAEKPVGAEWIKNDYGTAAGFYITPIEYPDVTIYTLPGIPRELRGMFQDQVLPLLTDRYSFNKPAEIAFRIFGLPESTINDRVAVLRLPASIEVVFNVEFPTITVLLRSDAVSSAELESHVLNVKAAIGENYVFAHEVGADFSEYVVTLLQDRKKTIAVAESCTGGLLGSLITGVPGASDIFPGGVISYCNDVKVDLLGVDAASLAADGAVSEVVAREMAIGVRTRLAADYGVALTGIAGSAGGSEAKPVGTVYIAVASEDSLLVKKLFFPFGRERFRKIAAYSALDMVRRHILGILDD